MSPLSFQTSFDQSLFRLSAIQKAVYRFSDRFFIEMAVVGNSVLVTLRPKAKSAVVDPTDELKNEVLDQELREVVADETARVRDLLLAQAFSPVSLIDRVGETANFEEDPLEIRSPDQSEPS